MKNFFEMLIFAESPFLTKIAEPHSTTPQIQFAYLAHIPYRRERHRFLQVLFGRLGFRALVAVFGGALRHSFNSVLGFGMRREHLLDVAHLGSTLLLKLTHLLESHDHSPGIATVFNQKVITAVIRFLLLTLREFGVDQRSSEVSKLRIGELRRSKTRHP